MELKEKDVVRVFAEELAEKQRKADLWFYNMNNQEMSDYTLIGVETLKNLAIKLGICQEVYSEAYKIYDFRNSGKQGYILKDGKIIKED